MTYTPPKVPAPPPGMGPWMRSVDQWIKAAERITPASKGITASDIVPGAITYVTVAQGATSTASPGTWPRADFEQWDQDNDYVLFGTTPMTRHETISGMIFADLTTATDPTMQPGFMGLLNIYDTDGPSGDIYPLFPKLTIRAPTSVVNATPRSEISVGQVYGQYGSDFPISQQVQLLVERAYAGYDPQQGAPGQNIFTMSTGNGQPYTNGGNDQGIAAYSYSDLGRCVFTLNSGDINANSATMSHYDNATQQRASMRLGENDGGIEIPGLAGLFSRNYSTSVMNSITVDGTGIRLDTATYCYSTLRVNGTTNLIGDVTINGNLTVGGTYPGGGGGGATEPTGAIIMWPTATAPATWELCQGQAVARVGTYAALFAVIGTLYGAGDGSTTFNLPDLTGRVPAGFKTSDANFGTLGAAVGAATVAGAAHTHTSAAHTHTSAAHSHTLSDAGQAQVVLGNNVVATRRVATVAYTETQRNAATTGTPGTGQTSGAGLAGATDSTTPGVTGSTTPGVTGSTTPTATSVVQPSLTLNFIIKL